MSYFNKNVDHFDPGGSRDVVNIEEIAPVYRRIFRYPFFNKVQSIVFKDVLYSDKSIVLSAPTGSGKTVIMELAIIRLLMNLEQLNYKGDFKIVYMAPVKALCTERLMDWYGKFSQLRLPCIEVTGDTDFLEISDLKDYKIIMTTPEKWDSLTRRWKEHEKIVQMVRLFLIDEVHLLKEDGRGPVLEAVVSRMKTIQESVNLSIKQNTENNSKILPLDIRFIAISATIPNAQDIAEWLGTRNLPAAAFVIGEEFRPVKLVKVVEGFPCKDGVGLFRFDMGLSYRLRPIIEKYCEGKPTLIFCNTRKSVEMTADILSKDLLFQFTEEQKAIFAIASSKTTDKKLQVLLRSGIGCHHAGFIQQDRNLIEELFRQSDLPVLITTSTLAMGVNLPAHLVIIKTTQHYINGAYHEYEDSTILQMMGRAGRPQFDTEGIAVIMTRNQDKDRYVRLVGGQRAIESSLHRHLSEHLNAEVALGTLPDLLQAMDWIRSTFLYVRAVKNPTYYGFPAHNDRNTIEKRLEELCLKCMNALARAGMLIMDSNTCVESTEAGRVMAANYLDFETMKLIVQIKGSESLNELLELLSKCHEFSDLPIRSGEKRVLNLLNRQPRGQGGAVCRFPQRGKIQTKDMKVNCLIQAMFGCLPVPDPSLFQEQIKIYKLGERISKCIMKYLTRLNNIRNDQPKYKAVLNSVTLAKCFVAKLWENSPYVVRQFPGIGPTFASLLVSSGKTTFQSIMESNPRDLERIMNKQPPAGNLLKKQAVLLPVYDVQVSFKDGRTLQLNLSISNAKVLLEKGATVEDNHKISLIVGDSENNLLLYESILDTAILRGSVSLSKEIIPKIQEAHTVYIHCISNTWVGVDINCNVEVRQSLNSMLGPLQKNIRQYIEKTNTKKNTKEAKGKKNDPMTLSPATQKSFLNNIYEEEPKNKKNVCDKAVNKIKKIIQTIPDSSQINTLSPYVNYYKPLPKQGLQNGNNYHLQENQSQVPSTSGIQNITQSNDAFDHSLPECVKNYYSRHNENDEFDDWCKNLDETNNESTTISNKGEHLESSIPNTYNEPNDYSLDSNTAQKYKSEMNNKTDNEHDERTQNCSLLNYEPLKISEENETFALDKLEDGSGVNPFENHAPITINEINETEDNKHEEQESYLKHENSAQNINSQNIPTKKSKKTKPILNKDSNINAYYKKIKQVNRKLSPQKKRKLDVCYGSQNTQNSVDLIESSPKSQCKRKFSKLCATQNRQSDTILKCKSIGINTDIQMVDMSNQWPDDQINSQPHNKVSQETVHEPVQPVYGSSNEMNSEEDRSSFLVRRSNEMIDVVKESSSKPIQVNVEINLNTVHNQIFIQNDLNRPTVINMPSAKMKYSDRLIPESKLITWKTPLTQNVVGKRFENNIQIEPRMSNAKCNYSQNTEVFRYLQQDAIMKIKEKMQEICHSKNIPTNLKVKILNTIKSTTNLSSNEFLNLYSVEALKALQEVNSIEKNKVVDVTDFEKLSNNETSEMDTQKFVENLKSINTIQPNKIIPKDTAENLDGPFIGLGGNINSIIPIKLANTENYYSSNLMLQKNYQVISTPKLTFDKKNKSFKLPRTFPQTIYTHKNDDVDMKLLNMEIQNTVKKNINAKQCEKTSAKVNITDIGTKSIKAKVDTTFTLNTDFKKDNPRSSLNNRLFPIFGKMSTVSNDKIMQKNVCKTKENVPLEKDSNAGKNKNIASILQKYVSNKKTNKGHITTEQEFNIERTNPSDNNSTQRHPMFIQYKSSLKSYLNQAASKNEDIAKYYRDDYSYLQNSQPIIKNSYLENTLQYNYNPNMSQPQLDQEDSSEDSSSDLSLEGTFKNHIECDQFESNEDILNPQKILAMVYSSDEKNTSVEETREIQTLLINANETSDIEFDYADELFNSYSKEKNTLAPKVISTNSLPKSQRMQKNNRNIINSMNITGDFLSFTQDSCINNENIATCSRKSFQAYRLHGLDPMIKQLQQFKHSTKTSFKL